MKKILIATILLITGLMCPAAETANPLMASSAVVWAGLDYSQVRMVASQDDFEYGFNVPDAIFPDMLAKWNELFIDERIESVANSLGKRVSIDIAGVTDRNKTATADQIILKPGPKDVIEQTHITAQDIAAEVRSYKMKETNGLGLVFIVDRLVHKYQPSANTHGAVASSTPSNSAAVYIVFFDIATRSVISAKREVHSVSTGGNFRNFWFGPIKDAQRSLRRYRVSEPSSSSNQSRR